MYRGFRAAALALLASAATPALAQEAPPAPRPIGDFARLPFFDSPVLSPDGKKVAAKISVQGQQVFAIVDLFGGAKPAMVATGDNDLLDWNWAGNDWLATQVGMVSPMEGEPVYYTRILGISADANTMKPIDFKTGGQSAYVIWTAPDAPRALIVRQRSWFFNEGFWPSASMVDLTTGRARDVVNGREGVMSWFADPSGVVRMGIGYNDSTREARLLYREREGDGFRVVDRAKRRQDETLTVPIFRAGGQPPVTIGTVDGFDTLNELDLATLTVGKPIWRVEGYDISSVKINRTSGAIEGVSYTSDRARMHWLDPKLAEVQALLDKAVGDGRAATIASLNADRTRMLVHVAEPGQPGSYYYYNAADGGSMTRIAWVNDAIKGARLGTVSAFRYKARDGLSIEAILTLPRGREAKALPLILMPHGGPEARDDVSYDWWAQFLADRGYAVVQPNYRGSTGYGEAFLKAGDGNWGTKMQDDLNDAVDDLAKRGVIDPKRVCIVGASYGGYAAMRGAQRDGARYRCAVSYAGVSDLNGMIRYDGRFLNGNSSRDGWKQSAPDLNAVSPINFAAQFGTPILVMHGKKDLRVPVAQSRRMVERLKAAGKPVEYIEQPLGNHYFSREEDRRTFLQALEIFLAKHNPA